MVDEVSVELWAKNEIGLVVLSFSLRGDSRGQIVWLEWYGVFVELEWRIIIIMRDYY